MMDMNWLYDPLIGTALLPFIIFLLAFLVYKGIQGMIDAEEKVDRVFRTWIGPEDWDEDKTEEE